MEHPPVSVIIPNYNGEHLLPYSLQKVYEAIQHYSGRAEVIVVDDASQDGSVPLIKESFPEFRLICHQVNKGFSEAVMTGVLNSSNEIIILLNTDVYPDTHFIAPLVRWFDREDTFSVSPLIYGPKGAPMRVSWNLVKIVRGDIRSEKWSLDEVSLALKDGKSLMSLFASGGSMAFRKNMFLELRGFMPIYKPFYYEDRDLCSRAWRRGWKTYFEPESSVTHDHQSTIKIFFSFMKIGYIRRRNRFIYLWLHLSLRTIVLTHIPWLILRLLGRIMKLDILFLIGFLGALSSVRTISQIRSMWRKDGYTLCLEDLLVTIKKG